MFFRKILGDSWAFVNSYKTKIRHNFQYQREKMLDWVAHLEHLQAILKEFDLTTAPNEKTLICYFQEGSCPFIRAQLDNKRQDLNIWDKVVEKAVDAEAKAGL